MDGTWGKTWEEKRVLLTCHKNWRKSNLEETNGYCTLSSNHQGTAHSMSTIAPPSQTCMLLTLGRLVSMVRKGFGVSPQQSTISKIAPSHIFM